MQRLQIKLLVSTVMQLTVLVLTCTRTCTQARHGLRSVPLMFDSSQYQPIAEELDNATGF